MMIYRFESNRRVSLFVVHRKIKFYDNTQLQGLLITRYYHDPTLDSHIETQYREEWLNAAWERLL